MEQDREKITGEITIQEGAHTLDELKAQLPENTLKDMTTFLGFLLASAIYLDASDVHTEPTKENVKIRLRVDGLLEDVAQIPLALYAAFLSRVKLVSGLKLNVSDRPQDGRFSLISAHSAPIEIRTATLPSEYGESVVLRVLNPKNLITLKELGLRKDLQELFEKEIKKPNGMIIVTGPTGSGKTTTLYAFLNEVKNPAIKIITIEDPIEYHLEGISQTQTNPAKGYDFASGLRAIVRQDPDVVLVGEIRDLETADTALQAALTGHLVFSTLHTNDAAGTISRLTSLGTKLPTVASALTLIIAQRLLRKVCKDCAKFVEPTPEQLKKIREANVPAKKEYTIPVSRGCQICGLKGYKGRVGIFEAIQIDDKTEEFILSGPSTSALKNFAIKNGMLTMYQDGLLKVLEGTTTIEEVERVTME